MNSMFPRTQEEYDRDFREYLNSFKDPVQRKKKELEVTRKNLMQVKEFLTDKFFDEGLQDTLELIDNALEDYGLVQLNESRV